MQKADENTSTIGRDCLATRPNNNKMYQNRIFFMMIIIMLRLVVINEYLNSYFIIYLQQK